MQKSESIGNLAKSLALVQASLVPAKRDSMNPFFKSNYADLSSVWDSCRELLARNGLSVIQGNSIGPNSTIIVETILAHESGQWIQSELCLPLAKNDPQGVGSAMTYGRRYGLAAIIGIVSDPDDDGNEASNRNGYVRTNHTNGQPVENAGQNRPA
ncbi:MAG: ERF family protein [Pyrinomonadaceae bacterium]